MAGRSCPACEASTASVDDLLVAVLIKDFDLAKTRLRPSLDPAQRRALAERCARVVLRATAGPHRRLVVAGSPAAAAVAAEFGVEAHLEVSPTGQNGAAQVAVERAISDRAAALVIISSDLPLLTSRAFATFVAAARRRATPTAFAAPATGRGGTNALYLSPPDATGLHFGDDSLARFAADARSGGVGFGLHRSQALALDLDEPSDLELLGAAG